MNYVDPIQRCAPAAACTTGYSGACVKAEGTLRASSTVASHHPAVSVAKRRELRRPRRVRGPAAGDDLLVSDHPSRPAGIIGGPTISSPFFAAARMRTSMSGGVS
jgi:hypothetical protein